jgi:hypothetical protein
VGGCEDIKVIYVVGGLFLSLVTLIDRYIWQVLLLFDIEYSTLLSS